MSKVRRDERGGIAVLVGLFFLFGIVLGAASLSLDTGKLMWERRELQNGADAGALSLAQSCAKGPCVAGANGLAALASSNAKDGLHTVVSQCGANVTLGACTPGALNNLSRCPPFNGPANLKYVEVETQTLASNGGFVTNFLARAAGGTPTTTVRACARVAFGPIKKASTAPVIFSSCEYQQAINTVGFGDPKVSMFAGETALAFDYKTTGGGTTDPCVPLGIPPTASAGGFGWLGQVNCLVPILGGQLVVGQPGGAGGGANGSSVCIIPGTTLLLPLFDGATGTGSNLTYHVTSFAAFYVTAVISPQGSNPLPGHPGATALAECKADTGFNGMNPKCIYGIFIKNYIDGSGDIDPNGNPNGPVTIRPMG